MRGDRMESKPNVIIIFIDDMGYGDLECYGSKVNRTPRINRMASEGVKFTNFYMAAPLCTPSRAALMTGCYAQRVGLGAGSTFPVLRPGDSVGLNPEEITIPRLLKEQGYATQIIGKWHLGDQEPFLPTRHGFDRYFGLPYSNDQGVTAKNRRFPPLPLMRDEKVVEIEPDQAALTVRYTKGAVEFIRSHAEGPFLLYFSHMYVHVPLFAPKSFIEASANGLYGAEVELIDWSTGVILDTLSELGLDEKTLVIFTSDNGATTRNGSSNFPLKGGKGQTWEGGVREPCIVRWQGRMPGGMTSAELCTSMDLLPTIAGLAGAEPPPDLDGKNIWPVLSDGAKSPHDVFFYYNGHHLEAVRAGKWKLHLDRDLLFDLEADTGETTDLLDAYPLEVKRLQDLAGECVESLGDGEPISFDPKAQAKVTIPGKNIRPPGRVSHPVTLTHLGMEDPLIAKSYD
jgi:arylsulfatase A-like enzyme